MISRKIIIEGIDGIGIKTAAKFVNVANKYKSDVILKKGTVDVNAKSILGLISLALISGDEIILKTDGIDEEECANKLSSLLSKSFN